MGKVTIFSRLRDKVHALYPFHFFFFFFFFLKLGQIACIIMDKKPIQNEQNLSNSFGKRHN